MSSYKMNFRSIPNSEFKDNELTSKYIDVIHGTLVNPFTNEAVGEVEAIRIDIKKALEDGGSMLLGYVMDSHYEISSIADVMAKTTAFDMMEDSKSWTLKDDVFTMMHTEGKDDNVNVTYIRENRIMPEFMGQGLGSLLLKATAQHVGKEDGLVLLESLPLQLCSNIESASEYKLAIRESEEESKAKLKSFYEKNKFQHVVDERHDWMVASTRELSELNTKVKVSVNTVSDTQDMGKQQYRVHEDEVSYGW